MPIQTSPPLRLAAPASGWRPTCIALLACLLSACASGPPKAVKARMTVIAQADVNPDATGRPSPIVIRVYQLQQDAKFSNADFFALFDDDQQALGGDLLARDEVTLAPGDRKEVEFDVAGTAKFVGVLAAYRDIRNSQWRALQPAPKKGLLNMVKKDAVTVDVGKTKVSLSIAD
jgi:type VI secretion system protein VasD